MQVVRVRLKSSEITQGCERAPIKVIEVLGKIKSKHNFESFEFNRLSLEEIHIDLDNIKEANELIHENSLEIFERNNKAFFIGGDNSISLPIILALRKIESDPLLIIFDAQANCNKADMTDNVNKTWLRMLIEKGFSGSRIILIATRNLSKEELDFVKKEGITLIGMELLDDSNDLQEVCDLVMERVRKSSGFFINLDIDSVDPGNAPGTPFSESGGLSSREIIYFARRLSILNNFKGAAIVNIDPTKDINDMTVKLGARLLAEMI